MPKFDVIIANPPYTNGVHLEHLLHAYSASARMVIFIHPMAWVNAQKTGRNALKNQADRVKKQIGTHFVRFWIVNPNKVFAIKLGQIAGITLIDKTKSDPDVEVVDMTVSKTMTFPNALSINPLYIMPEVFESIRQKIWNHCLLNNIEDRINKNAHYSFFINLPLISGHVDETGLTDRFYKKDFYQLIYETDKLVASAPKTNKQNRWLSFETKVEAEHCLEYLANSRIAAFSLMIVKSQQNLHRGELLFVPAFDFARSQTDVDRAALMGLTELELQTIFDVGNNEERKSLV